MDELLTTETLEERYRREQEEMFRLFHGLDEIPEEELAGEQDEGAK